MINWKPSNVDCTYGAPMGRCEPGPLFDNPQPQTFALHRVPLDNGGYDSGGAYWGIGEPLWAAISDDGGTERWFRAATEEGAKEHIRREFRLATFATPDDDEPDEFTYAYIEALLFFENDESDDNGGEPLANNYYTEDLAPDSLAEIVAECKAFQRDNAALLDGLDVSQCGHDFYLTRQHHGAGFWDRGLGEIGDRLTDAAHAFGEFWPYVGDDGMIHIG